MLSPSETNCPECVRTLDADVPANVKLAIIIVSEKSNVFFIRLPLVVLTNDLNINTKYKYNIKAFPITYVLEILTSQRKIGHDERL